MDECYIYGIYDSREGSTDETLPHYVGFAVNSIAERREAHLRDRDNPHETAPRVVWMRTVPVECLLFVELARAPIVEIGDLEIEMIARYKQLRKDAGLSRLTNRHPGGFGGRVFGPVGLTPEERSQFALDVWEARRRNGTTGQSFTDEERTKRSERAKSNWAAWNARVASGEVVHPSTGRRWPGLGKRTWEARRMAGLRTQGDIIKDLSVKTGLSAGVLSRALKGKCAQVKQSVCNSAWSAYADLSNDDKMLLSVLVPDHAVGEHPKKTRKPRGPISAEGRERIAAARRNAWARMTDDERKAMGQKQEAVRRQNRLTKTAD